MVRWTSYKAQDKGRQGDGSFVSLGRSVCQDRRTVPLSLIGPATLTAIFDISGRTAMATDAGITGSGQNGWTYDHGTTRLSGNKAYGTACFKSGSTTKSMTLTLTCSPMAPSLDRQQRPKGHPSGPLFL